MWENLLYLGMLRVEPGMGGHGKPVGTLQASQALPALRARTPLSLRDISPRSGESPLKGEPFCAGGAREESLPSRGGGREAGRKGFDGPCGYRSLTGYSPLK